MLSPRILTLAIAVLVCIAFSIVAHIRIYLSNVTIARKILNNTFNHQHHSRHFYANYLDQNTNNHSYPVFHAELRRLALDCPEGQVPISSNCQLCPGGTYWRINDHADGGAECIACPIGKFSLPGAIELASCQRCPLGFYATTEGSALCTSCGPDTTTIPRGASNPLSCYCDVGFKVDQFQHIYTSSLSCIECSPYEWCTPGQSSTAWTVKDYCRDNTIGLHLGSASHLCSIDFNGDVTLRGKCIAPFQCPTRADIETTGLSCLPPFTGVKCLNCITGYGQSVIRNPVSSCTSCWIHFTLLAFLILGFSTWSLLIMIFIQGNQEAAIGIWRIFVHHWQILTILRLANIQWHGWGSAAFLRYVSIGFPLAEIFTCITQNSTVVPPYYVSLQIVTFFPLILIVWTLILSFILQQLSSKYLEHYNKELLKTRPLNSTRTDIKLNNDTIKNNEGFIAKRKIIEEPKNLLSKTRSKFHKSIISQHTKPFVRSKSFAVIRQLRPQLFGTNFLGLFIFFYYNLFLSFTRSLYDGIQCVSIDGTGLLHVHAGLDFTCDEDIAITLQRWCTASIVLWVWVVPIGFMIAGWYYMGRTKSNTMWGYLIIGLRKNVRFWNCINLFRNILMLNILGLSPAFKPNPVVGTIGYKGLVVYEQLPDSDIGTSVSLIVCMILYCFIEMIRERYTIDIFSGATNISRLTRLSMIATMLTFISGIIVKWETSGLYGYSSAYNDTSPTTPNTAGAMLSTVTITKSSWIAVVTGAAALGHIAFILYFCYRLWNQIIAAPATKRYLPMLISLGSITTKAKRICGRLAEHFGLTMRFLGQQSDKDQGVNDNISYYRRPICNLSILKRNRTSRIILEQDATAVMECINLSSDAPQTAAGLLLITLYPWSLVETQTECFSVLYMHGFDCSILEDSVHKFLQLRERLIERLDVLSNDNLVQESWECRFKCLLRYPELDNPKLQLIPSYESTLIFGSSKKKSGNNKKKNTQVTYSLTQCFNSISMWILSGYQNKIEENVERILTEKQLDDIRVNRNQSEHYYYPFNSERMFENRNIFLAELCQKLLQTLLLDLAEAMLGMFPELPFERFLATGVPAGTRNDGRTDARIRNYQRIIEGMRKKEATSQAPQTAVLHRLLRERAQYLIEQENLQRKHEAPITDAAVTFAEIAPEDVRKKREFEMYLNITSNFLNIFPDARPCYHAISKQPDDTSDPQKLVTIMQNRTLVPRDIIVNQLSTDESITSFFRRIIQAIKNELRLTPPITLSPYSDKKTLESRSVRPTHIAGISTEEPLAAIHCAAGEFSTEPRGLGVLVLGNLSFCEGPDGSQTAITTQPYDSISETDTKLNTMQTRVGPDAVLFDQIVFENARFILFEPIIELAPEPLTNLVAKDADWSLESWIFLPLSKRTEYHSLCCSENGNSLLTISTKTNEFGIWEPLNGFIPFGPEGTLVNPMTLDKLETPCWHFITLTASAYRTDPDDPLSMSQTIFKVYIDGHLGGRIERPYVLMDIETLGNTRDSTQPFGCWSGFTLFPKCFNDSQIKTRYTRQRVIAEERKKRIQTALRYAKKSH